MSIEQVHTAYSNGEYQLEMTVVVTPPPERVLAVIRDYPRYGELDARIVESRVLERTAADRLLLFTRIDVCYVVFCRKVERVERVQELHDGLHAIAMAERSDVTRGETRTELRPQGTGTRIHYTTGIAPKFWVPVFARQWMLRRLRDATVALFTHVEARAASAAGGDVPAHAEETG